VLAVDPGFDPRGVVLANVDLPSATYPDYERVQQFYRDVLDRLRSVPGVTSATAASLVPVLRGSGVWDFQIDGRPAPPPGAPAWNAAVGVVREHYFEALGMPIRDGRAITAGDGPGQPPAVVVNESFARKFFAGENPIGQRLRVCCNDARPWATVVGVAGDVRDQDLETAGRPIYYLAHAQSPQSASSIFASMAIVARTDRPDVAGPALRQIVRDRDPDLPLTVQQYSAQLTQSYARRSFATTLFAVFAGVGLLLGATGIYAVLAYGVARLTPEIGIRRALGASSGSILGIVLRQGLVPAVAGLALGIAAAVGLSRFLESQLFEVSAVDPAVYGFVAAGVLGLAAAACLIPARRAARVSPLRALRDV
jgi:putative ABC transport system permease protein